MAPVLSPAEAAANPQLRARGMLDAGASVSARLPIKFVGEPELASRPAPALGAQRMK